LHHWFCTTKPGIVTSVVEDCRITLDNAISTLRHWLACLADARAAADRFCREGNVSVSWERLWQIEPVLFIPF